MKAYPSMVRLNARRRGPIESRKLNKLNLDIAANIQYLYDRLTLSEVNMTALLNTCFAGNPASGGVIPTNDFVDVFAGEGANGIDHPVEAYTGLFKKGRQLDVIAQQIKLLGGE